MRFLRLMVNIDPKPKQWPEAQSPNSLKPKEYKAQEARSPRKTGFIDTKAFFLFHILIKTPDRTKKAIYSKIELKIMI